MRHVFRLIAATFLLVAATAPVSACINDYETHRQERQFKSLYPDTPSSSPNEVGSPILSYSGVGGGVALLVLAAYLGLIRRPW